MAVHARFSLRHASMDAAASLEWQYSGDLEFARVKHVRVFDGLFQQQRVLDLAIRNLTVVGYERVGSKREELVSEGSSVGPVESHLNFEGRSLFRSARQRGSPLRSDLGSNRSQ